MKNNVDADRFPSRKHPRLKKYDYSSANYYFITICSWNKECLFGKSGIVNSRGKAAEWGILQIPSHFHNVHVDKFVVMPNHVHMILALDGEGADVPTIVGQYKSFVTRMIRQKEPNKRVWQASFHDHVIRNQESYEKIWLYIDANPQNWEKDCFFEESKDRTWSAGS